MRIFVAILLTLLAAPSWAAWPRVTTIRFEGNEVTRESVLRREMALAEGDEADPARVSASRQALLDLGLFRSVDIVETPQDGGVALTVRVREKYFLLPIPRLDTSSDRDFSYGVQFRWNNIGGRNHILNLYAERGDFPEDRLREAERNFRLAYDAPYLLNTPFSLKTSISHIERRRLRAETTFDETLERAELLLLRDLRTSRPRRGWVLGGGLFHQNQDTEGTSAPPRDGSALALVGTADFANLRYHLHSETGERFRSRLEWAPAGGDYRYTQGAFDYARFLPLGETPHQTLHLIAEGGWRTGGPDSRSAFFLGGSGNLRGYPSDYFEGERYWRLSAEYLRPIRWDWLRLLALAEVGGIGASLEPESPRGVHASIGLGVRIRLTWLVNVEVELGAAWPLRGGEGARFFAGGN